MIENYYKLAGFWNDRYSFVEEIERISENKICWDADYRTLELAAYDLGFAFSRRDFNQID